MACLVGMQAFLTTEVPILIGGAAVWGLLFLALYKVVFPKRSYAFSNRVVSIVHAVASLVLAYFSIAELWPNVLEDVGASPNSRIENRTLLFSATYFLYDFFGCLLEPKRPDVESAIHHIFTLMGLVVGLYRDISGTELVACLMLMEISNPMLHLRFCLREIEWHNTSLATVNEGLFVLLFVVCRIFIGPVLVHATVISKTSPVIVKVGGVGILAVSLLWFSKIMKIASAVLFGRPKKSDKKE